MKTQVTVTGDATGKLISISENPDFGYIRVQQRRNIFGEDNFVRTRDISALIHGAVKDLKELGYKVGQSLPGKIVIKESLTPLSKKAPEKDIKVAGKTGIVCSVNGMPVYRRHFYTENMNIQDELVQHDNVDEIAAAFRKLEEEGKKNPEEATLTNPK